MQKFSVIIAEDDEWYARLLEYNISLKEEFSIEVAKTGEQLIKKLKSKPDIITLDYSLPDYDGHQLLKIIQRESPETDVIIISGQEDVKTAISLLNDGAYDYIIKDEDTKSRIWKTLSNVIERRMLTQKVENLQKEVEDKFEFGKTIVGKSNQIKDVFSLLTKAAKSSINVSITGETGTGKEVAAKAIHYNSNRKEEPFVAINVSAIPSELIESELFGHEKGAFTGAEKRKIGKFELAGKGTIFLDEIGEMDEVMQVKLLRVLQERELTRVGGNDTIKIDCRIICATHKDLNEEVTNGNFRQDLFYRIIGLPIELPPLRNRKGDVLLLANHFISMAAKENRLKVKKLTEKAADKLLNYHFPGNIRELKSIIDLGFVLSDEDFIEDTDLKFQTKNPISELTSGDYTLRELNQRIIQFYLEKNDNDVRKVASILDIGKSTIYRMLKEEMEI